MYVHLQVAAVVVVVVVVVVAVVVVVSTAGPAARWLDTPVPVRPALVAMSAGAGDELHVVVHEGRGPHALLVHGFLGSRSYWADNLPALAEVCRPVVVELWGHGRSPSPGEPARYHHDAYATEFERLRSRLGIDRWVTIGQSMGAGLTLNYGLAHPDRVLAQVVTNSSSAFTPVAQWAARQAEATAGMVDLLDREGMEPLRDHWLNPGRSRRIRQATRALLAAEFDEHDAAGVARCLVHTNARLPLGDRLAEVSTPTLLTLGVDEDRFLPLVPRARLIPGLETVELGAAHAVNAQDPDGWNAAVVEFLSRICPVDGHP